MMPWLFSAASAISARDKSLPLSAQLIHKLVLLCALCVLCERQVILNVKKKKQFLTEGTENTEKKLIGHGLTQIYTDKEKDVFQSAKLKKYGPIRVIRVHQCPQGPFHEVNKNRFCRSLRPLRPLREIIFCPSQRS